MKRTIITLWTATAVWGLSAVPAGADFVLTGSQYLEVTSYHYHGQMYETSMAWIHDGGSVTWLEVFDWAVLGVGPDGSVDSLGCTGHSQALINGGWVDWVTAYETAGLQLLSGTIQWAYMYDQTTLNMSGGTIGSIHYADINAFGPQRLNLQGGTIQELRFTLYLHSTDQVSWTGQLSELYPHGLWLVGGMVESVWPSFVCFNQSQLNIGGGWTDYICAYHTSTVHITDGEVGAVDLFDGSSLFISGGEIGVPMNGWGGGVYATGNSTIQMTAGQVARVSVVNVQAFGPTRVWISGGNVQLLYAHLIASDQQLLQLTGSLSELEPHGISVNPACIEWWLLRVAACDQARVEISGGEFEGIEATDQSQILVTGGSIGFHGGWPEIPSAPGHGEHRKISPDGLGAWGQAQIQIRGGQIAEVALWEATQAQISGGLINWLIAGGVSLVRLEGGFIANLDAYDQTIVTFYGCDFQASEGLSIEGNVVLGTGLLSGKWADGSPWETWILAHDSWALIRLAPGLLGDTNFDGVVDLADYNNVVNNLGSAGSNVLGDTNLDGVVDLADYNNVVNNLGATVPGMLAVPEPTSLTLISLAGFLIHTTRKR